jgi:hypothetical protein
VPVPTQLFQGSLLLGSITRLALGPEALARPDVMISPLVIAGGFVCPAFSPSDCVMCYVEQSGHRRWGQRSIPVQYTVFVCSLTC